MMLENF
jgi:hypothetical protein